MTPSTSTRHTCSHTPYHTHNTHLSIDAVPQLESHGHLALLNFRLSLFELHVCTRDKEGGCLGGRSEEEAGERRRCLEGGRSEEEGRSRRGEDVQKERRGYGRSEYRKTSNHIDPPHANSQSCFLCVLISTKSLYSLLHCEAHCHTHSYGALSPNSVQTPQLKLQ